ncbi:hypothetical protein C1T17_06915 [Sphingobium sp. SCG-1]|uniref:hypothetical protein n=1 Tax=Sphingobium sp. SCG-1 TaxID=2072936 RepID=UPI000CD6A550|nr:hypothetical protein [Sphingobium sp. SCG-1]AUW57873.1 hypothetical protein C1T17_06915 [Sphingobium sp. SCG-1]
MLAARSQVAAATVLCDLPLFCFTPQPLPGLRRGEHGEAQAPHIRVQYRAGLFMADDDNPPEIHWPDEINGEKRAELRDALVAYDQALTDLEADAAAVFSSDGERNGVFHSFLKRWDRAWSKPGSCMHDGCSNLSIPRSHTISLGASIRLIADNGHVQTPRYGAAGLDLVSVGVRDASTFPGFCTEHENLFSAFETQKTMTEEQHFRLQAFRTICREIYSKRHQKQKADAMLAEHRLRRNEFVIARMQSARAAPPLEVSGLAFENDEIENRLVRHLADIQSDLPELEALYEGILPEIRHGSDHLAMLVANFGIQLSVCLSGFGVLNYERDGEAKRGLCFLAIIPESGNTKIMIGAASEHSDAIDLHAQDQSSFSVLEMLESWMIHGTDHWFIAPSAWSAIPAARQRAICERIMEPLSLADRSPFSILDDARRQIIALAEAQLAAGAIDATDRPAVERTLQEQRAKLDWMPKRSEPTTPAT